MRLALVGAALAACGRIGFDPQPGEPDAALGTWGVPVPVFPATSEINPTLTGDQLELYFARNGDIYVATRAVVTDPWNLSSPALVTELSTVDGEGIPEVASDGLTIYFVSDRAGTGHNDIYMATRASRLDVWSGIVEVVELGSTAAADGAPVVADDKLSLVMSSARDGNSDLFTSTRTMMTSTWAVPVPLPVVNSPSLESDPFMSADRLTLYFRSDRSGNPDLFIATRASIADAFDPPAAISELDTSSIETDPWVSPDGREIYFSSDRSGTVGIWEATR